MVPLLVPDIQDLGSKNSSTPLSRDYLALEACRDGDLARATRGPMTADRSRASSDRWSLVMIPAVVTLRYRKTVGSLLGSPIPNYDAALSRVGGDSPAMINAW